MTDRFAPANRPTPTKAAAKAAGTVTKANPISKAEADETVDDLLALANAIAGRIVGGDDSTIRARAEMEQGEQELAARSLSRMFQRNPILAGVVQNAPFLMFAGVVIFWGLRVRDLREERLKGERFAQPGGQQIAPRQIRRGPIIDEAAFMRRERGVVPTVGTTEPPADLGYFPNDPQGDAILNDTFASVRASGG